MRMAEEFERCSKCGEGWFKIERRILIEKGSRPWAPMHHKEVHNYTCTQCGYVQYTKAIDTN